MRQALIGHTGFVGSNLLRAVPFDFCFNSRNIEAIRGRHFDRIVCAGSSAAKWIANQSPIEDRKNISHLLTNLAEVTADVFVHVSTVDIYPQPLGVDESYTPLLSEVPDAYGRHRLGIENFVLDKFDQCHVVRLPGLFGPGLKKNAIFDLLHDNRLEWIHPRSLFQWYPVTRLAGDIELIVRSGARVVNIATEPTAMEEIRRRFFPKKILGGRADNAANYDFRTRYSGLWGRSDGYCLDRCAVLSSMDDYLRGLNK